MPARPVAVNNGNKVHKLHNVRKGSICTTNIPLDRPPIKLNDHVY